MSKKEKNELSSFNKVRYILELEGEICSRDDVVPRVRQIIYELKKETTMEIFLNCAFVKIIAVCT